MTSQACEKLIEKSGVALSKNVAPKVDNIKSEILLNKAQNVSLKKSHNSHSELITTKESFYELKTKWNTLLESSSCENPFMTWEWMFTWWEVFGDKKHTLFIIAVYEGDNLISIAPFYIKKQLQFFKRLGFIGEGEKRSDAIITHYPDIIVREEDKEIAITQIVELLNNSINNDKTFNYAKFDLIKKDAVIHDVSNAFTACDSQKQDSGNQFRIDFPKNYDEYFASLSKSVKKQFKRKQKSLEKAGDIEIVTIDDLSHGLEVVEELHRSRWKDVHSVTTFDSKPFCSFHTKLSERLADQDLIEIRAMKLNGKYIVASYNFSYKNGYFSYLGGFNNSDEYKRYSPMFTCDVFELKRLIAKGYKSFDFLVSESESSYKERFGSTKNLCEKILWITKSPYAYALKPFFAIKKFLIPIVNKYTSS